MPAQLTWHRTNAPVASSRTDDIWFLDPQLGWAVNSNGHVLKTTNGGASWTRQFAAGAYLRCIAFADAQTGWVGTLTPSRRMFRTTDGGATWERVTNLPTDAPVKICGLAVVNANVVYAAGTNEPLDPPRMMKTTDGGRTWTAWDMRPFASILIDTFFTDELHGWVVGGKADDPAPIDRSEIKAVVLFTEDGGRTWTNRLAGQEASFPFGEWGWKIQFLNERLGFVSLENFTDAAILKTTDGGQTWTRIAVTDPEGNANLEGIGFLDESRGWVGGWGDADFQTGRSSATDDGGATWRNANEIGRFLNRFRFFGNPVTVGYASGDTVYKYSAEAVPAPAVSPMGPLLVRERRVDAVGRPAKIPFNVPAGTARLTVDLWDRFGKHVGSILDETRPADGLRTYSWDGHDAMGRAADDGTYLFRVTADAEAESGLLVLRTRPPRRRASRVPWVRYEMPLPPSSPLRAMAAVGAGAAALAGAAPPAEGAVWIELPNLSGLPTPIEKARFLLHSAAEIEHALLAQYLYAAYSLKKPTDATLDAQQKADVKRWSTLLLGVAKEEMGHLMTVQNLLLLTRQPLNFEREDFPQIPKLYPFKMQLEPLTQASLSKYVVAESPANATGIDDIIAQATVGAGMINRVGVLYALIGVVFTKQGEPADTASDGDPWTTIVRDVGNVALRQDPEPAHWHLPDDAFSSESLPRQASDAEWAPARAIRVFAVGDRKAALEALRDIALQGEGPVVPTTDPSGSHFQRFLAAYRGGGADPPFPAPTGPWQPARNVPVNPKLEGPATDPDVIQEPKAKAIARLADLRYALLLGFLEQYFLVDPGPRGFLITWSYAEMGTLKALSDRLTSLPRAAAPQMVAALPFTLPAVVHLPGNDRSAQWQIHIDRLSEAIVLTQQIIDTHTQGDTPLKNVLTQLKAQDEQNMQKAKQAQQGLPSTVFGRWEQVRRILDSATGFGKPHHEEAKRFWNLPLSEFLDIQQQGEPIIAPPGPERGKNSNLIKALKAEPPFDLPPFPMPKNRPPIAPEYIAFIEKWIDDNCPEV